MTSIAAIATSTTAATAMTIHTHVSMSSPSVARAKRSPMLRQGNAPRPRCAREITRRATNVSDAEHDARERIELRGETLVVLADRDAVHQHVAETAGGVGDQALASSREVGDAVQRAGIERRELGHGDVGGVADAQVAAAVECDHLGKLSRELTDALLQRHPVT